VGTVCRSKRGSIHWILVSLSDTEQCVTVIFLGTYQGDTRNRRRSHTNSLEREAIVQIIISFSGSADNRQV
jgi:hypothetical protein